MPIDELGLVERLRAHGAESWAALMDEAAAAIERLLAQRDKLKEALTEIAEFKPRSIDFAAPSEISTFTQGRARQALAEDSK